MNGGNSRRAIRLNPIEALILCISVVSVLENSVSHDCDLYTTAESNTSFFFEFDTIESSENLPDTLDIGDVSESGSSSECAAMKLKTVVGEATASSSGSPGSTVMS
ncbi:hypothetical protein CUMW_200070 [Citrus unshiu]|uniref:Uncharacterized protein n=1 Tax=Citrus unshiu TaxID=55188 RepID=A0A2H5Q6F4_CITUN|nr:hypothetical protein CUMW_200070 [Citrus unshiu]